MCFVDTGVGADVTLSFIYFTMYIAGCYIIPQAVFSLKFRHTTTISFLYTAICYKRLYSKYCCNAGLSNADSIAQAKINLKKADRLIFCGLPNMLLAFFL